MPQLSSGTPPRPAEPEGLLLNPPSLLWCLRVAMTSRASYWESQCAGRIWGHSGEMAPPSIRDLGSPRYAGEPVARGVRDVVLLGFFLASGSSAVVGIKYGGDTAAWITGTLAMPGMQGSWRPLLQEIWHYSGCFSVRIELCTTAAWIMGTLVMPSV